MKVVGMTMPAELTLSAYTSAADLRALIRHELRGYLKAAAKRVEADDEA